MNHLSLSESYDITVAGACLKVYIQDHALNARFRSMHALKGRSRIDVPCCLKNPGPGSQAKLSKLL